jgi:hypothetical protein
MAVQVDAVGGIERVLLALQPVAVEDRDADLAYAVWPHEDVPAREERRRRWPEISPDQPTQLLHRIGRHPNPVLEGAFPRLEWRLQTATVGVVQPAMVRASQSLGLGDPQLQPHAAMGALVLDQAQPAAPVPVQDEVFAQNTDFPNRVLQEAVAGRYRLPVAPHERPHRHARPNPTEPLVCFFAEHSTSTAPVIPSEARNP